MHLNTQKQWQSPWRFLLHHTSQSSQPNKRALEIHSSNKNEVESEALSSDSEKLLKDCTSHFESQVKQIVEEYSDVGFLGIEDLNKYLAQLKEELNQVEAESANISNEIEDLSRNHIEESNTLEGNLEGLKCALDSIASQAAN